MFVEWKMETEGWLEFRQEEVSWEDTLRMRKNAKELLEAGISGRKGGKHHDSFERSKDTPGDSDTLTKAGLSYGRHSGLSTWVSNKHLKLVSSWALDLPPQIPLFHILVARNPTPVLAQAPPRRAIPDSSLSLTNYTQFVRKEDWLCPHNQSRF